MPNQQKFELPESLAPQVEGAIREWETGGKTKQMWNKTASVWTGQDEAQWLGWLPIVDEQLANLDHLYEAARIAREGEFRDAVVLGMGGSSLCPEVLSLTFGQQQGYPALHILDSTDPAQIKELEEKLDLDRTLFIVSSKSGTTLEPNIFKQYFFEQTGRQAKHFFGITDPGSKFQQVAERDGFRKVFFGVPSIGGRYSALSNFGMVPAAVMGLDIDRFLKSAAEMVKACQADRDNPGVALGAFLGVLGRQGRDKVTIIASPAIFDLGAWLEQLLAESTGKDGKGLIPVDREPLGPPQQYGQDRVFAYIRYAPGADAAQDAAVDALAASGQPVVRIDLSDLYDLGQEMYKWEIATAVAGSFLGINPFNQPDVEASKVATRKLTSEFEQSGSLPKETPFFQTDGIQLFADMANLEALQGADPSLAGYLKKHLARLKEGDYCALLAYLDMNAEHERALTSARTAIRNAKHVATCVGFGPRFLHSTGQAYKGGPNSGVFLQITGADEHDLPIPEQKYTFGIVKAAQARGDLQVLEERRRRALRLHLTGDVKAALDRVRAAIEAVVR